MCLYQHPLKYNIIWVRRSIVFEQLIKIKREEQVIHSHAMPCLCEEQYMEPSYIPLSVTILHTSYLHLQIIN